jgi:hypothetical protein
MLPAPLLRERALMTSSRDISPEQVRTSRPASDTAAGATGYDGPAAPFPLPVRQDVGDPDFLPGAVRRMPKKHKHEKDKGKGKEKDKASSSSSSSSSSSGLAASSAASAAAAAPAAAAAVEPQSGLEQYRASVRDELILRLNDQDFAAEVGKNVEPDEDEAAPEPDEDEAAPELAEDEAAPHAEDEAADEDGAVAIDAEVFHETWEEVVAVWQGFEDVATLTRSERAQLGRDVAGFYRRNLQLAKNAPGSGKSKGGWASNATRTRLQAVTQPANFPDGTAKAKEVFAGGEYTAHHKVSQSNLSKLAARAEKDGMTEQLKGAIGASGASLLKPLLNFPGNLEAGPRTERRTGDPGSGFDPNLAGGAMTPRSRDLAMVHQEIDSGKFDWDVLLTRLKAVKATQDREYGGQVSVPKLEQWTKSTGGKFKRE